MQYHRITPVFFVVAICATTTFAQTPRVDHSLFNKIVSQHVDSDGWVDYAALKRDSSQLDQYIAQIAQVPFDKLAGHEKLALLINAYNAFTLRLILDYYPIKSIKDIPSRKRWKARRWNVGGHVWSLNDIEHEQIRPKFNEPRIHFALVCAAVGCPPLRNEAYVADKLESQLEAQSRYVHSHGRWLRYDGKTLVLTKLYDWYGKDFGSVTAFAARYDARLQRDLRAGLKPHIAWLDYDWALNDVKNRPRGK